MLRTCKVALVYTIVLIAIDVNRPVNSERATAATSTTPHSTPQLDTHYHSPSPNLQDSLWSEQARAVPPTGWRKTNRGWERVAKWAGYGPPINQLIHAQKTAEPVWAQSIFRQLTRTSPLTIALIQIAVICAICVVANRRIRPTLLSGHRKRPDLRQQRDR